MTHAPLFKGSVTISTSFLGPHGNLGLSVQQANPLEKLPKPNSIGKDRLPITIFHGLNETSMVLPLIVLPNKKLRWAKMLGVYRSLDFCFEHSLGMLGILYHPCA